MTDIYKILQKQDIEVKDKKAFEDEFFKNYKTVAEFEKQSKRQEELESKHKAEIEKRDNDLKELQGKLSDAENGSQEMAKLKADFENLQKEYDDTKKSYDNERKAQIYASAIDEEMSELKFSSNSAKEHFKSKLLDANLKVKDGKIFGFSDFVEDYRTNDKDAFLPDGDEKPEFSAGSKSIDDNKKVVEHPLVF